MRPRGSVRRHNQFSPLPRHDRTCPSHCQRRHGERHVPPALRCQADQPGLRKVTTPPPPPPAPPLLLLLPFSFSSGMRRPFRASIQASRRSALVATSPRRTSQASMPRCCPHYHPPRPSPPSPPPPPHPRGILQPLRKHPVLSQALSSFSSSCYRPPPAPAHDNPHFSRPLSPLFLKFSSGVQFWRSSGNALKSLWRLQQEREHY